MKSLYFLLFSLAIHLMLIFSTLKKSETTEFAFKKGEIAMELLETKSKKSIYSSKTEGFSEVLKDKAENKTALPISGIVSGSALGLVAPEYPESSRMKGEEGEVIVAFDLDENEKLVASSIEKTSGFPALDKSALKAVESHYASAPSSLAILQKRVRFLFQLNK